MTKLLISLVLTLSLSSCFMTPGRYEIKVIDFRGKQETFIGTYSIDYKNHRIWIMDEKDGLTSYFLWGQQPEIRRLDK